MFQIYLIEQFINFMKEVALNVRRPLLDLFPEAGNSPAYIQTNFPLPWFNFSESPALRLLVVLR
jgi:hypothetical protein